MKPKPIPDGYATLTPYLMVRGAAAAIDYYKKVFGATERMRMPMPDGRIGHAEIEIGGCVVMLADEGPEGQIAKSPQAYGGSPVTFHLYVADPDATFAKAIAEGGKEIRAVANQFYGDRSGVVSDPFGHLWNLATHVEDVSPEEMDRRMKAMAPKS
jgi:PhnB protein